MKRLRGKPVREVPRQEARTLRQNIHLDKVLESRDPLGLASCITSYC